MCFMKNILYKPSIYLHLSIGTMHKHQLKLSMWNEKIRYCHYWSIVSHIYNIINVNTHHLE